MKALKIVGIGASTILMILLIVPSCIATDAGSGHDSYDLDLGVSECPYRYAPGLGPDIIVIDDAERGLCHIATEEELWGWFFDFWDGDWPEWILW